MRDSKEYSWARVTADQKLNQGPCELIYAYLVPSGATTDSVIYNGVDTSGEKIVTLKEEAVSGHPFKPPVPVFCSKGLFVDVGSSVSEIFVLWRNL
ncbi:MAG: hypothetical protein M0R06_06480 [Sphaerochaeta sp.]|jgi:hypothetical protein|nr:hypothetical protein [Sphaerochaeta sp.]MDD4985141.1 hypothetical protein [Dehalococcoidales bacterium]